MTTIGLYTDREVFGAGLQLALAPVHRLQLLSLEDLALDTRADQATAAPQLHGVILDAPPEAPHLVRRLRAAHPELPLIVWQRVTVIEPALNALAAGARGVVLDTTPAVHVLACLKTVLSGGVWAPPSVAQASLASRSFRLTCREGQIATMVSQGLHNKEIAYSLGISEGTVKVYLSRLFDKVGVSDRYELALLTLRQTGSSLNGAVTVDQRTIVQSREPAKQPMPQPGAWPKGRDHGTDYYRTV